MHFKSTILTTLIALASLLSACAVGPDYVRPTVIAENDMNNSFKEDWTTAQPQDKEIPTKWWTIFNDDNLNALIEQIATSNLTLAQAEANYRQATALADNAKAGYYPHLTGNLDRIRSSSVGNSISNNTASSITTKYSAGITASWEMDLWGGIRRAVEVQQNQALSSFANVQSVLLSMQSQLAQNYFQLRVLDVQQELLDRTVQEYRHSLTLTQHQYKSGVVATDSVLLAKTQLKSTEAQALDVGIRRAQLEHAIAVLTGKSPTVFSIPVIPIGTTAYMPNLPDVPVGLPSTLLERRPDVAASERSVAAANAQIGVTKAAYFPTLTLNALSGYQSSTLSHWLTLPNRIWSVGPALAASLFDGGARKAHNAQAIAAYDATVANYRQTVLTSFQNVEDNLVSLRILKDEAIAQNAATMSARKALNVAMNQYKAGTVNYLNVVTAQTMALSNERAALAIKNARLIATVQLITALGGGWIGLENTHN